MFFFSPIFSRHSLPSQKKKLYRKSNDEHIIILRSLIMSYIILPIKIVNDAAKNDHLPCLFYFRLFLLPEKTSYISFKRTSVISIKKMLSKHYKFTATVIHITNCMARLNLDRQRAGCGCIKNAIIVNTDWRNRILLDFKCIFCYIFSIFETTTV